MDRKSPGPQIQQNQDGHAEKETARRMLEHVFLNPHQHILHLHVLGWTQTKSNLEFCGYQPPDSKNSHAACSPNNQLFRGNLAQAFCSTCPSDLVFNPAWEMPKAVPILVGVAEEWEDSRVVRKVVRSNKKLIQPLTGDDSVHITGKTAGHNYEVMAPLVMRLKDERGEIHAHRPAMPEILDQSLVWILWNGFIVWGLSFFSTGATLKYFKRMSETQQVELEICPITILYY